MAYTTIDNPELYFQTKLYTGTGSSNSVTLDGSEDMQPDWVWIKVRSNSTHGHNLYDSVRGVNKPLQSETTSAEGNDASSGNTSLNSFDSDGFTLGGFYNKVNQSGQTFVAWNWKAGGSASSNSNGTETTNVSVNTTAGFSIITYSGTTAVDTYGHGLSQKPEMMIFKTRTGASRNWVVYHKDIGATKHLHLNTTDAENTYQFMFNNTEPTSSVITLSDDGEVNKSGSTYVGYIFHSVKGYSKFGSYTGNGDADGTFVYTGFRPAWIMIKKSSGTENWSMYDAKRNVNGTSNTLPLNADNTSDEAGNTGKNMDILSNGVKMKTSNGELNLSGATYIYMAFAESPFVNSKGVPNNAR